MIFPNSVRHAMRAQRHGRNDGGSIIGALFLIFFGLMFLGAFAIPGLSPGIVFGRGWPLILLFVGTITVVKGILKAPLDGGKTITGGLIVITIGLLFLAQFWAGIGFHRTWPVLLVVIGALILLRKIIGLFVGGLLRRVM